MRCIGPRCIDGDHGWGGAFVRYVGWWLVLLVGLAVAGLPPAGLVVLVGRDELAWSSVIPLLAWFGIGTVMALLGYEAFRTRRSFTTTCRVDDAGIVLISGDRVDQQLRWDELTMVRIEPMSARIELCAPALQQPYVQVNGNVSYAGFRRLWTPIAERAGPVATVVRPSTGTRALAIAVGLSVVPVAIDELFGGEPARGALMMLCGAIGIYAAITGIPRFFETRWRHRRLQRATQTASESANLLSWWMNVVVSIPSVRVGVAAVERVGIRWALLAPCAVRRRRSAPRRRVSGR